MTEEKKKDRRGLIVLLLLIIGVLIGYIYYLRDSSAEMEEPVEEVVEEEVIEEVEPEVMEETPEPIKEEPKPVPVEKAKEPEATEEVVIEEVDEVEVEPVEDDRKFGLTFQERSEIWDEYQRRQGLILEKGFKEFPDKSSRNYLSYVDTQIGRMKRALVKEYNIKPVALDYIIEEGKRGKFN